MITLSGRNTRTITGYVVTLLEYPRWVIEREVDFTNCHLGGHFDPADPQCSTCHFGTACRWLQTGRTTPHPDAKLPELLMALGAAVEYLHSSARANKDHYDGCECDACQWLAEARAFLRTHRHHS
jgi:hypothetical protein